MAIEQTTRVLIVDDSEAFRHILDKIISALPGMQIIGSVGSGADALEFLRLRTVDLMTLDVEMPTMNGIQTLEKMIELKGELKSVPDVLMVSSHTRTGSDITLKALELGAFDFVAKPGESMTNAQQSLTRMLQNALTIWKNHKRSQECFRMATPTRSCAVNAKPIRPTGRIASIPAGMPGNVSSSPPVAGGAHATGNATTSHTASAEAANSCMVVSPSGFTYTLAKPYHHNNPVMAIVLGVSTGGPKSLTEMLPKLCSLTDLPIMMVQHMPPNFTKSLAESLDAKCKHTVVEGAPGMVVESGHIYIAPGGCHMTVRSRGASYVLETNQDPPENGCRPSVDVLFRSAARAYPTDSLIGIILTGMGNDGTPALRVLKEQNAYLIAQNEESSVVFGMPRAAAATGLLDKVATLMRIPEAVVERIQMVKK